MMPDEKTQLLGLLKHSSRWCRDAEANDADGEPVRYDDERAVAWDLTGALCRLFGWQRASELFGQIERHILGKRRAFGWPARNDNIEAMRALQDYNDGEETSFEMLHAQLESMPVWSSTRREESSADGV